MWSVLFVLYVGGMFQYNDCSEHMDMWSVLFVLYVGGMF